MFTRRRFLKGATLVTAGSAGSLGFPQVVRAAGAPAAPGQKPRHIIHLVSDGMSLGTLSCADQLSRRLRQRGTTWVELSRRPEARSGWMDMHSHDSLVPDSAAAASSWGSGSRLRNGAINHLSDGRPLRSLYELFTQASWRTGLVTTAEITHATPAGFAASVARRAQATTIARQYLERRVDVLLGGGAKFFDPAYRLDKQDLRAAYAREGYFVMDSLAQLAAAPTGQRWLGLFARGHLPYTLDHRGDAAAAKQVPTLAAMTAAALRRLENAPHFILQVEGARIDHACHNNDAAAALHDQLAFDEAIDVCLEFQKRVPDTLLVIMTDHGNANPGLNGTGDAYVKSTEHFARLGESKRSFAAILPALKRDQPANPADERETDEEADKARAAAKPKEEKEREKRLKKIADEDVATPTEIIEIIGEATGYKVPADKAEVLRAHLAGGGRAMYDMRKSDVAALGELLANHHAIGFTGTAHTSDYVPVLALGPGAEQFTGFFPGSEVFHKHLAFAGIDFRNPEEKAAASHRPEAGEVEDVSEYLLA